MQSEVRPHVCVCACKPSIAKRAFLLLRLKSSTLSASSNADSMMRTAATWVWAVSLLLLLLLLLLLEDYCANISFRKQRLPQLVTVICGWSWYLIRQRQPKEMLADVVKKSWVKLQRPEIWVQKIIWLELAICWVQ